MFHFFVLYVLSIFSVYGSHVCVTSFPEQFIVVLPWCGFRKAKYLVSCTVASSYGSSSRFYVLRTPKFTKFK